MIVQNLTWNSEAHFEPRSLGTVTCTVVYIASKSMNHEQVMEASRIKRKRIAVKRKERNRSQVRMEQKRIEHC